MVQYFFHLKDRTGVVLDDMGEEFPNIEEAKVHANHVARELWRNRPEHVVAGQRLLMADAAGVVLHRIPFALDFR